MLAIACIVTSTARRQATFYLMTIGLMLAVLLWIYWIGRPPIEVWLAPNSFHSANRVVSMIVFTAGAGAIHLAARLLERGHTPIVYSTQLGDVSREIRERTIVVTDNLETVSVRPDIIHGNHSLETMTALLQFPDVPAIHTIHGNLGFLSAAPKFPRILRYIPVDDTCCDRIVYENGIDEDRIRVILNSVDLKRFTPRSALPTRV